MSMMITKWLNMSERNEEVVQYLSKSIVNFLKQPFKEEDILATEVVASLCCILIATIINVPSPEKELLKKVIMKTLSKGFENG